MYTATGRLLIWLVKQETTAALQRARFVIWRSSCNRLETVQASVQDHLDRAPGSRWWRIRSDWGVLAQRVHGWRGDGIQMSLETEPMGAPTWSSKSRRFLSTWNKLYCASREITCLSLDFWPGGTVPHFQRFAWHYSPVLPERCSFPRTSGSINPRTGSFCCDFQRSGLPLINGTSVLYMRRQSQSLIP